MILKQGKVNCQLEKHQLSNQYRPGKNKKHGTMINLQINLKYHHIKHQSGTEIIQIFDQIQIKMKLVINTLNKFKIYTLHFSARSFRVTDKEGLV